VIANRPVIAANTASKPGCFGVGVAVGFFVSGVGVSPRFARHAIQSGFGSHGSFGSVPVVFSSNSSVFNYLRSLI